MSRLALLVALSVVFVAIGLYAAGLVPLRAMWAVVVVWAIVLLVVHLIGTMSGPEDHSAPVDVSVPAERTQVARYYTLRTEADGRVLTLWTDEVRSAPTFHSGILGQWVVGDGVPVEDILAAIRDRPL